MQRATQLSREQICDKTESDYSRLTIIVLFKKEKHDLLHICCDFHATDLAISSFFASGSDITAFILFGNFIIYQKIPNCSLKVTIFHEKCNYALIIFTNLNSH